MYQKNGYFFRSKRKGKRVETEYIGAGPGALFAVELDQLEAQAAAAERKARETEAAEYQVIENQLKQTEAAARDLAAAALLLAGYHPHKRQWRRHGSNNS